MNVLFAFMDLKLWFKLSLFFRFRTILYILNTKIDVNNLMPTSADMLRKRKSVFFSSLIKNQDKSNMIDAIRTKKRNFFINLFL